MLRRHTLPSEVNGMILKKRERTPWTPHHKSSLQDPATDIDPSMLSLVLFANLAAAVPLPQSETQSVAGTTPYQGTCKSFEWDPKPTWEDGHLGSIPVSKRMDCRQSAQPCSINHADEDTKRPTEWSSSAKLSDEGKAAVDKAVGGGELPPKPAGGGFEGASYSLSVDPGQIGYLSYNPAAVVVHGIFKGCEDGKDHDGTILFPTGKGSFGIVTVGSP